MATKKKEEITGEAVESTASEDETKVTDKGAEVETKATDKGAQVYTRDEIASSKKFRTQKWLVYAVIYKEERITLAEAERRVNNYLKAEI